MRGLGIAAKAGSAVVAVLLLWSAPGRSADLPPPSRLSGVAVPEERIDAAISQLDALADAMMARSRVPGMAIAVVRDGRTVYAKGFGVRKSGEAAPVTADTVFQLASLSKPICGTVIAHQVGVGAVGWDTPVKQYLPWFRLDDAWVTAHLTIGDLLSHRSGLPDHAGDALEDLGFSQWQVLERLRQLPLTPFRVRFAYTNFGFTAAAEAVAAASGKDWATLSEEVLYRPLGMASTSSRFSDFERRENRAVGHVLVGASFVPKFQRQPDAQSAAGGVSSSANDLARWMAMLLGNGTFEGRKILDAEALLPAMTAQTISNASNAADARPGFYGYGFGVGVTPAGRTEIKHSGGFAMGAATHFVLLPSLGIGIVVLTNAWPIGAAEAVAAEFTDLVQFGRIDRDWFTAYGVLMAPLTAPMGSVFGQPVPPNSAPAADLTAYAGTYGNAYYGDAQIVRGPDGLVLRIGPAGIEYPLAHRNGDAFTFHPSSENQPDGSISLATFAAPDSAGFRSLTIEYLDSGGLGTFVRGGAGGSGRSPVQ